MGAAAVTERERLDRWLQERQPAIDGHHPPGLMDAKNLGELYERYLRMNPFDQLEVKRQLRLMLSRTGSLDRRVSPESGVDVGGSAHHPIG